VAVRLLIVMVLVVPLSAFVIWAVGPAYAAWIVIPYGMYVGWVVSLAHLSDRRQRPDPRVQPTRDQQEQA
jgi:hypothetical protein